MQTLIILLAIIGLIISVYAYYVEKRIMANAAYKPACDINDTISCTKPLTSTYAKLFFVSNTLVGMLFYLAIGIAAYLDASTIALALSCAGVIMTVVLAYLLYFKVKAFCLVCTSIYLVNVLLFYAAIKF